MSYLAAFRVTVESIEEACLLRVSGEIDSSRADDLRVHLRAARRETSTTLLDLAEVSFIDSAGLRVLLEESDAATGAGETIFIVRPSRVVRRVIEITDSANRLAVVPANGDLSMLGVATRA